MLLQEGRETGVNTTPASSCTEVTGHFKGRMWEEGRRELGLSPGRKEILQDKKRVGPCETHLALSTGSYQS